MEGICFVNMGQLTDKPDAKDAKAVKQHIRQTVLSSRRQRNIDGGIRFFTGTKFVKNTKLAGKEEAREKLAEFDSTSTCKRHWVVRRSVFQNREQIFDLLLRPSSQTVSDPLSSYTRQANIALRHPYTDFVAAYVRLPADRIDQLLKSRKLIKARSLCWKLH